MEATQLSIANLLILGVATMRLGMLLAHEDGPWNMFVRLRHVAGVRYDETSQPYGTTMVARGMICVWCNSIWWGMFFALAWHVWPAGAVAMALPFALSGLAIVVSTLTPNGVK